MSYDITQVSSVYDALTAKIKTDLDEQFNLGRIKGSDYADVYAKLMQTCLQLAFQAPLNDAQIEEINSRIDLNEEQKAKIANDITISTNQSDEDLKVKEAQKELYERQKQGFDDNLKQKLFEIQMGAWSTMFNSGLLTDKPAVITNDEASTLYNNMKTQLGIS